MVDFIREQLVLFGLDVTSVRKVELASEEALINVIMHGYKGLSGQIDIEMQTTDDKISIIIKDQGPLFNPLEQDVGFDPSATLEERKIGGLGILFMRQYVDEIHYSREEDTNVLILVKQKSVR